MLDASLIEGRALTETSADVMTFASEAPPEGGARSLRFAAESFSERAEYRSIPHEQSACGESPRRGWHREGRQSVKEWTCLAFVVRRRDSSFGTPRLSVGGFPQSWRFQNQSAAFLPCLRRLPASWLNGISFPLRTSRASVLEQIKSRFCATGTLRCGATQFR